MVPARFHSTDIETVTSCSHMELWSPPKPSLPDSPARPLRCAWVMRVEQPLNVPHYYTVCVLAFAFGLSFAFLEFNNNLSDSRRCNWCRLNDSDSMMIILNGFAFHGITIRRECTISTHTNEKHRIEKHRWTFDKIKQRFIRYLTTEFNWKWQMFSFEMRSTMSRSTLFSSVFWVWSGNKNEKKWIKKNSPHKI